MLCRGGLARLLISPKRHVRYTVIQLIKRFSTRYFPRSNEYMLRLNSAPLQNHRQISKSRTGPSDDLQNQRRFRIDCKKPYVICETVLESAQYRRNFAVVLSQDYGPSFTLRNLKQFGEEEKNSKSSVKKTFFQSVAMSS